MKLLNILQLIMSTILLVLVISEMLSKDKIADNSE